MEVLRYLIKLRKLDDIVELMPLGDIHWGSPAHDREDFLKHAQKVLDNPNLYTIGMGDYFDNNSVASRGPQYNKNFNLKQAAVSSAGTLEMEIEQLSPVWDKLASKTIGMHLGNHEDRTMGHDEFKQRICKPGSFTTQGLNYLGDFAMTALTFVYKGKVVRTYIVVSGHGSKFGGQAPGTVQEAARKKFMSYDFDVALFGHTHYKGFTQVKTGHLDTIAETPQYRERKRFIFNTGSFVHSHVEGFDAYTDKSFGSLRDVGTVTVRFNPYEGKLYALG